MPQNKDDFRQSLDSALQDLVIFIGWMLLQQVILGISSLVGLAASCIDYLIGGDPRRPLAGLTFGLLSFGWLSLKSLTGLNGTPALLAWTAEACVLLFIVAVVVHLLAA